MPAQLTQPVCLDAVTSSSCAVCIAAVQWYPVAVEAALDPAVPHKV